MARGKRILVVSARGCDWEYGCGGTVLKELAAGGRARVVVTTTDMHADLREAGGGGVRHLGPVETAALRRRESEAAAAAAGAEIRFLDFRTRWYWDGERKVPLDWRRYAALPELPGRGSICSLLAGDGWREVLREIEEFAPDAIFTHPVGDIDQENLYTAHAVFYAVNTLPPERRRALRVYLWRSEPGGEITPLCADVVVDISAQRARKYGIIALHESARDESRLEASRIRDERWGRELGVEAAEAFALSRFAAEGLV
jgi:LmbE family N-acetylglucosaminyl deacetylase